MITSFLVPSACDQSVSVTTVPRAVAGGPPPAPSGAACSRSASAPIISLHPRDALDLCARVEREAGRAEGAARRVFPFLEERPVHLVHRGPLLDVREEHRAFHDVLHVRAVLLEHVLDVLQRLARRGTDAARPRPAVPGADLTSEVEHVTDAHGG